MLRRGSEGASLNSPGQCRSRLAGRTASFFRIPVTQAFASSRFIPRSRSCRSELALGVVLSAFDEVRTSSGSGLGRTLTTTAWCGRDIGIP